AGLGLGALRIMGPEAEAFDREAALERPAGATIAVMPLEALGGGAQSAYLAEGLGEDLVVELGRFRDLNVLSRQATLMYVDDASDPRRLGRLLGADYILQGSVRQAGGRLRVTARLYDARTGAQVWSEAFDEAMTASDLFDVQLRITERVAYAVGDTDGAIQAIDARVARAKPPESLTSYECTLNHSDFFDRPDLQERVRGCILRVVAEEPDYWRGWAQLADALRVDVMLFAGLYDGTHPEKLEQALEAAQRAVSLNPDSPRAHYVLASVRLLLGDREGFFAACERALGLGGDRFIEGEIGYWFVWAGRLELGAALLRRAVDLNPAMTSTDWHRGLAEYHFLTGDYREATRELTRGREPHYWWAVAEEVAILSAAGDAVGAARARDRMFALRPDVKIADIVWVYRRFQRPEAHIAKYVEAFARAGIPAGNFAPLDLADTGVDPAVPLPASDG
ncbi:MAG: tetratricopeptide repeat protein, partial [Pseudomonadota bacterium]